MLCIKDATNDDNLDACLTKNSKTLGQCILDCEDDISCESACVATFKVDHSECPCQVRLQFVPDFVQYLFRKNAHWDVRATVMIVICPRKRRFWHFTQDLLHQFLFNQMVSFNYLFVNFETFSRWRV